MAKGFGADRLLLLAVLLHERFLQPFQGPWVSRSDVRNPPSYVGPTKPD